MFRILFAYFSCCPCRAGKCCSIRCSTMSSRPSWCVCWTSLGWPRSGIRPDPIEGLRRKSIKQHEKLLKCSTFLPSYAHFDLRGTTNGLRSKPPINFSFRWRTFCDRACGLGLVAASPRPWRRWRRWSSESTPLEARCSSCFGRLSCSTCSCLARFECWLAFSWKLWIF